ncbi:alpha/beta hydrolase fold domain-containing protein, partial [Ottowia sp.]|uniref:alpha/beta hydrolase fold domain-containing protein n=1 Tax=Ottowia sp. TaxID=1898956 RepID=UPI0039E53C43
ASLAGAGAPLMVGGDSAGGNLAAVVALAARDDADGLGPLPIAYQLLIYPGVDMRRGHPSHQTNGEGYVLTRETMDYFVGHYLPDPGQYSDWRASPLLAASHARLPPALVLTAGYDPLADEGLDYARALSAAGNRVSHVCFGRQIHGFITMGRVLDEAHTAVALCAAELRRTLRA